MHGVESLYVEQKGHTVRDMLCTLSGAKKGANSMGSQPNHNMTVVRAGVPGGDGGLGGAKIA